ncbi:MAG: hypothetical protein ABUS47_05235 [Steroidobacter sp.]
MESRIPLPTDNIYKFCALFGLLLTVFSIGSMIYVNRSTNELVFSSIVELKQLETLKQSSVIEQTKLDMLTKQLEIAQADKKVFQKALSALVGVAFWLAVYGFWKWHFYIQPMQDELLKLQIKKLKAELRPSWRRF